MKRSVTILAVLLLAGASQAAVTSTGGGYLGGSWGIGASAGGTTYDLVAARISPVSLGVDVFESPALRNIVNPSWNMVLDGPTLVSMSGPSNAGSWELWFVGAAPPPVIEIDWALFSGQTKVVETHWVITNGTLDTWSHSNSWNPTRASVVPVPGAMLLGSLGVGLAGWMRKRKKI